MSDIKTEIIAGTTTFITMAYIIFVNPAILSAAGVPFEAVVLATCIGSGLMTIFMGLYSNYPFALAPGMGLNAVVAFTLCGQMGLSYSVAMGMIVIEGLMVTIFVLTRTREAIMDAIPKPIKLAIGVGIGIFIAFIGLSQGGIIEKNPATLVSLGNLKTDYALTAIIGLMLTSVLLAFRLKASIFIGIILTAIVGFLFGVVSLPQKIFSFPTDFSVMFKPDIAGALKLSLIPMIFALFMTDFFDTMGTVIGVSEEGGFLDKDGKLPRLKNVLLVDSLAAVCGGLSGSSSITTYIESAAGVAEGGKTGKTSVVTGTLFLISIFLIPIVCVIGGGYKIAEGIYKYPVTAPALIIVGFLMMSSIKGIDFKKTEEGIPAFLTIIGMPLTYNISHGIGFGFVSYTLIKLFTGKAKELHPLIYIVSLLFIINFTL
ncbi:MAG: NCS2 family permease [Elusimicrobia bacterium]|nr:NCS2 family permease [Elusimicrobiota bacterium]